MRADEHEGDLNDTLLARQADQRDAEARKILAQNLLVLTDDDNFLLWFQKYCYPVMVQDVPVNNGSALAQFMGRRQVVLQVVAEMDLAMPGFLSRVLAARDRYEKMLLAAARPKEK